MRKKTQRIFAGILAVIISIAMIGSGIIGFFFSGDQVIVSQSTGQTAEQAAEQAAAQYQNQKESLEAMARQTEIDPDNLPLLLAVASGYYQLGIDAQRVKPAETQGNFELAVNYFQIALAEEKDPDLMQQLAQAAYYSGDIALAEQTYKELVSQYSDAAWGFVLYGWFLYEAKKDYEGAIEQLQKAMLLTEDDAEKEQFQSIFDYVMSQAEYENENDASVPGAK